MKIKKKWLVIFLLPATLIFALVYAVPVVMLTATSFTDWVAVSSPHFNGIDNYIKLFQNSQFLHATVNTLIWMVLQSTVHYFYRSADRLDFGQKKFYWKFTRTVYMFPNIISSAAIGMLFVMLLNPSFGIVNKGLEALGFQNLPNWFSNSSTAFFRRDHYLAAVLPPLLLFLVMAEMTSLDVSILEAAKVDGATEFQTTIRIILPLMKNIIGTTTVLGATSMLQKLDILMMTTKGGPGDVTLNLPYFVYNTAFSAKQFGLANSVGVLMIIMGLIVVGIINRIYRVGKQDD